MIKLGTNYGGWAIPEDIDLDNESIVYSGGVGEDISFDLLLSDKYDCNIVLIDPTVRAVTHYNEIVNYYKSNKQWVFSGDIQKDYQKWISDLNINFSKISYENIGLWDKLDTLKFYKQTNPLYVSQSVMENMFGDDYYEVTVDSIKNIMEKRGDNKIDLLKLDIEGAEIKVLNNMLDNEIYPRYLCIEFDLFRCKKDINNETAVILDRLKKIGYVVLLDDDYNITFKYLK
jgi:FkbM family methyltransferase